VLWSYSVYPTTIPRPTPPRGYLSVDTVQHELPT
jgi:hypothetical protein